MVPKRLWLVVSLLPLVLVPLAGAAKQALDGRGTLTGSGTSYQLGLANIGDQVIRCMQLWLPAGSRIGTVTPPAGWLVGVDSTRSRIGAQNQQGLMPGGTATFTFTTEGVFGSGSSLRISSDCREDKVVLLSGPGTLPPPPPKPKPKPRCQCDSLEIIDGRYKRGTSNLGVNLEWRLTCTPKSGRKGCEGKIEVVPPQRNFDIEVRLPKDGERVCEGNCKKVTEGPAFVRMNFVAGRNFPGALEAKKGQSFRFKLKLFCKRGEKYVQVGTKSATFVFGEDSRFDPVQSDMNANGKPDGDEKKK